MLICIDPGHGGNDPGASHGDIKEKNIVQQIASQLIQHIVFQQTPCPSHTSSQDTPTIHFVLTRSSDINVPLEERAHIANTNNADCFISLHVNAFVDPSVRGFEAHTFPGASEAKACAETIRQSIDVIPKRPNKTSDFVVLRETRMPAVLLECGFITNENDRTVLTTYEKSSLVNQIAKGIATHATRTLTRRHQ